MSARSRWLPAESSLIISDRELNSRGAEKKHYTGYAAWQVIGGAARAANGDLIALAMRFDPPDLLLIRSRDGGRHWLPPQPVWRNLNATEFSAVPVGLTCLSSGRLLAMMRGERPDEIRTARPPAWSLYSDDHGMTWQPSRPISHIHPFQGLFTWNLFEHRGIVYSQVEGKLLDEASRNGDDLSAWGIGLIESRNFGQSWEQPRVLLRPDRNTRLSPTEHQVIPISADRWLMVVRLRPVDIAAITVSTDAGRTWGPLRPVLADSANHRIGLLPDGNIILAGMGPYGVRYLVSHDEGNTWAYEHLLEGAGDICGGILSIDERTAFVLYGSATGRPYSNAKGTYSPGFYFSGLRGTLLRKLS